MDGSTGMTDRIRGCAVEVHRCLGPGLLENTYERALCVELTIHRISFKRQVRVPVLYRDEPISDHPQVGLILNSPSPTLGVRRAVLNA